MPRLPIELDEASIVRIPSRSLPPFASMHFAGAIQLYCHGATERFFIIDYGTKLEDVTAYEVFNAVPK